MELKPGDTRIYHVCKDEYDAAKTWGGFHRCARPLPCGSIGRAAPLACQSCRGEVKIVFRVEQISEAGIGCNVPGVENEV